MSDDETISRLDIQLSDLKKQRGVIKGRLTLFANYINKLDRSCLDSLIKTQVQMRIHSAAIFFVEFNDVQSKIERIIVDEKELLLHLDYRDSFECQYYSIVAIAKNMIGDCEQNGLNNSQCISGKSVSIKLPQIKLPAFDGSFDKWLEFRNSYVSMIHDRDDLDPIQKFQYLKSSLSGSALHVISSLEFTAPNYINAWDLLEARYQNNRLLIHNHVKALFAAPSLGKECPAQIRTLVDCVLRNLRALNSLKEPESSLEDVLMIHLVVSKLDSATEREWENYRSSLISDSNKTSKPLKLEDLLTFLNNRSDMLDMISSGNSKNNQSHSQSKNEGKQSADHKKKSNSQTTLSYASANNIRVSSDNKGKTNKHKSICPLCSGKHALYSCVKFLNMLLQERLNFVKSKNVCQNCLRTNTHTIENCNFGSCKLCQQKHNALIHVDSNSVIPNTSQLSVINDTLPQSSVLHCVSKTADNIDNRSCNAFMDNSKSLQTVLLSTALIEIADIDNCYHTVRALLDSGSQNCFIAQSLCKRLKLPIIQSTIRVCGVGQTVSQSSHKCDVNIRSKVHDFNTTLHCLVLPSIISKLPSTHVNSDAISIPSNILLADPTFYVPSDIDLLIGADVFWDLLKENKIKLHTGPYLQDSLVGWIISGPVYNNNNRLLAASVTDVQCNLSLVDSQLRKFWEIEELNIPPVTTEEDRFCEELFLQTTERDQQGRFNVRMPFKQSPDCLGDSHNSAKQRFLSLERKLDRLPQYKRMYCEFMHEYEQLGHMTRFEDFNMLNKPYYIIPHHGVYRESSVTTKLRVVFDASATTSNNNSLNDIQYVGPRLQNDKKHPVLLCHKHRFTWLLCSFEHKRLLHAGPQLLVAAMRERWWVLGARSLARQVVHKCVTCIRMKGNTLTPHMGDLPAERLEAGFPFMRCGVDYAGPISILNRKGRGSRLIKGYICLFVCFATRAVHLELVSSLSTQDYLLAFKRFISRRGKPCQVFSDNGKNFVGAERELSAIFKNSNEIIDFASNNNIIFSFIPPYAPHFGGLWEAGVKSCKYHLRRVVGNAKLTYEEFSTVLTQVEAVLNSRPMSPMSSDPSDYFSLTPAHFLIGRPLIAPASEDFTTSTPSCRYHRLEQLRQHFWERWSKEYVSELQRRTKWAHKKDDIAKDSLVVIKEDNLPPLKWKMGRIIKLFPGKDGVSRVAEIRTSQGTIKRASSKICPLPV